MALVDGAAYERAIAERDAERAAKDRMIDTYVEFVERTRTEAAGANELVDKLRAERDIARLLADELYALADELLGDVPHLRPYADEKVMARYREIRDTPQAWARRMEAKAWIDAFGDATPPPEIADEVARYRQTRQR